MTTTRLDVISVGGTLINTISSTELQDGLNVLKSRGSADVTPLFIGHGTQVPQISFATHDLMSILVTEGVGIFGKVLDAVSYQYWKTVPQTGRNLRTAELHYGCAINQGVVYWERINLRNNELSTMDVVMMASFDGENDPVVISGSVALPTAELTADNFWGCGPIQINGTLIPLIEEVTIESGIQAEPRFSDSVPYPFRIDLKTAEPRATITTGLITHLSSMGLIGGALNGTTGLAIYGRKFTNDASGSSQRVPAATAQHLKISCPSGTVRVQTVSASGEDAAQLQIVAEIRAKNSGDTPMAFSASAIPTS